MRKQHTLRAERAFIQLLSFVLILFLAGCEKDPRKELEKMNIGFSGADFVEQAGKGNLRAVQLFLDAKIGVAVANENGTSPLMAAAREGHEEIVKLLLSRKANINAKSAQGETALFWAVKGRHEEAENILRAAGAKGPRADLEKQGIAYSAPGFVEQAGKGNAEAVKLFLTAGMDVNAVDAKGNTALMKSAGSGTTGMVKLLLAKRSKTYLKNNGGYSAVMLAARAGHVEIVRALLDHGADQEELFTMDLADLKKEKRDAILAYAKGTEDLREFENAEPDPAFREYLQEMDKNAKE